MIRATRAVAANPRAVEQPEQAVFASNTLSPTRHPEEWRAFAAPLTDRRQAGRQSQHLNRGNPTGEILNILGSRACDNPG